MAEEKMVPIDTSGNSVEVTLKEETKESEWTNWGHTLAARGPGRRG